MILEILLGVLLGVISGIFTGLTPGVHINLISVLVVGLFSGRNWGFLELSGFILGMSVVHTFMDVIPSVYLGAPDESQALGMLPGHRFLHKGLGHQGVVFTVIGSLVGLLISVVLFPFFVFIVKNVYEFIKPSIGYILLIIANWMIVRDRNKRWAIFIFLTSALLGYIVLNFPKLDNPLFPLLSGLFGVSTLLYSVKDKNVIPKQKNENKCTIEKKNLFKAAISGQFSGFLTATLPGIGSGTAAVIAQTFAKGVGDAGFLVLIGSISTVNFVLSLSSWFVLDKARNGSVIAIREFVPELTLEILILFLFVLLIAGAIGAILTIFISKKFSKFITKIKYELLIISIIIFIILMTLILTSWIGFIVLLVSTAVGLIPAITKTARIHSMGCILGPVMIYFLF